MLRQLRSNIQDGLYNTALYDSEARKLLEKRKDAVESVGNVTDEDLAQSWKQNRNVAADYHNLRNNPKNTTVDGITYDELGNEVFNKDKHGSIEWLNSMEGRKRREHDYVLDEYFKKKVKDQGIDSQKLEQDYQNELQDRYGDSEESVIPGAQLTLTAKNTDYADNVKSYRHRKDGGIDVQFLDGHYEYTPGEKDWNCNHYSAGNAAENLQYCKDERGQKALQNLEQRINRERDAQWEGMSTGDKIANGFAVLGSVGQDYILPAVGVVADFIPGGQAIGALANAGSAIMDATISGCRHFNECSEEMINNEKEKMMNNITKGDEFTGRVLRDDNWASLVAENKKAKELVKGKLNEWGMLSEPTQVSGEGKPQYDVNPVLTKQLREIKMTPKEYLDIAREAAELSGYDPRALDFSDVGNQKLKIYDDEGNVRHFGAVGYGDYIIWSKTEAMGKVRRGYAQQKRSIFRRSHLKIKGDWKKDKFSPNNLALQILWSDKQ
jgi:hypothetical protein